MGINPILIKQRNMKLSACVLALALCAVVFVQADELKDLSSADVAAPVEAASLEKSSSSVAETQKSDLGEGTGSMFAGALMTSGSFTMMAAGAFEEEEELGEGEGTGSMFAGALMTSGSFTMMAAGAF